MNFINADTPINDYKLQNYFDSNALNTLKKLKIENVRDFIKTPFHKFVTFDDGNELKKLQQKLSIQLLSKNYTLKNIKDIKERKIYSTGIESINGSLPEDGLIQGKFYDFVGNVDGPILTVILTIICNYLIETKNDILWIDTCSLPDLNTIYQILLNKNCDENDILNIYFEKFHVVIIDSFLDLEQNIEEYIKEFNCEMIIINSLSHFLQGNLLPSSPLHQKTIKFLNNLNSIVYNNELIVINVNFLQYQLNNQKNYRLIETVLKNGFYSFPDIQILITSHNNDIRSYLIKPQLVINK